MAATGSESTGSVPAATTFDGGRRGSGGTIGGSAAGTGIMGGGGGGAGLRLRLRDSVGSVPSATTGTLGTASGGASPGGHTHSESTRGSAVGGAGSAAASARDVALRSKPLTGTVVSSPRAGGGGGGGGGSWGTLGGGSVIATTPLSARLAACRAQVSQLKAAIEARKGVLQTGGLSEVAVRPLAPLPRAPMRCRTLAGHGGKVYALAWSRDNQHIISTAQDMRLFLWHALRGYKVQSLALRVTWAMTCAWSPDDELLAWGGLDNACTIAESSNPTARRELRGHEGYVSCTRFLADGNVITSSGDGTCVLWDIRRSVAVSRFTDHDADVLGVAPCPLSTATFASCSTDETARVWDARDPRKATHVFGGHDGDVNSVQYMPSGRTIVTAGEDGSLRMWDLRSYARLNEMASPAIPSSAATLAISASGRLVFAGHDDCKVHGWDALDDTASTPAYTLSGHTYRVSAAAISPDGRALCSGSWDRNLMVWA